MFLRHVYPGLITLGYRVSPRWGLVLYWTIDQSLQELSRRLVRDLEGENLRLEDLCLVLFNFNEFLYLDYSGSHR